MGRVIMSGIVPTLKAPVTGVLASSLAVGSTVKLMEGGTAVEYLVVNQGIPQNSSLYDASCDGTWLLRKYIHSERQWNTSNVNTYVNSDINTWLNGDFFNSLGTVEQSAVKPVKIPYGVGNGSSTVNSGTNGLSVKAFLLSCREVGGTSTSFSIEGVKLDWFETGTSTSANNKRISTFDGSAVYWWLRSPVATNTTAAGVILYNGDFGGNQASFLRGIRPALVLSGNAVFDETTMILKGVK